MSNDLIACLGSRSHRSLTPSSPPAPPRPMYFAPPWNSPARSLRCLPARRSCTLADRVSHSPVSGRRRRQWLLARVRGVSGCSVGSGISFPFSSNSSPAGNVDALNGTKGASSISSLSRRSLSSCLYFRRRRRNHTSPASRAAPTTPPTTPPTIAPIFVFFPPSFLSSPSLVVMPLSFEAEPSTAAPP